jgi:hypothetical protein
VVASDRAEVTLHWILIHVIAETHRHAGHADIIRELIDDSVGLREGNDNMAPVDEACGRAIPSASRWWRAKSPGVSSNQQG